MGTTRLRAQSNESWMDALRQVVQEATSADIQARRIRITEDENPSQDAQEKFKLRAALRLSSL